MTDRELLERAAKAAGIRLHVWGTPGKENFADMDALGYGRLWNPLNSDGDALRLATRLRIDLDFDTENPIVEAYRKLVDDSAHVCAEAMAQDANAATRRAIVRAAAALGEGME